MPLSKRQLIIIGVAFVLVVGIGALFVFGGMKKKLPEVSLVVWGTESPAVFEHLTKPYEKVRRNVKITYVELLPERYEETIFEALASGQGPDVFMIGNRDLLSQRNKLLPAPVTTFSLAQVREFFPTVVEDDFVDGGYVYALPLSIDTLALFYNKDLLDRAALTAPPTTWEELLSIVEPLRSIGSRGEFVRAAAALGGTMQTIATAPDILQLLFMQNGVRMLSEGGAAAAFASGEEVGRAVNALRYYLQFADAGSAVYTWNESQSPSREAFAAGKVAMILDYQSILGEMRRQSPFLRIGVAPAPQVTAEAIAFPKYKGLAVSRQSFKGDWAWDFVVHAATNPGDYLVATGAPPALRNEIARRLGDPELDVFARQALIARSWRMPAEKNTSAIFDEMLRTVLLGQVEPRIALERAEAKVTQLLQGR